MTTKEENKVEIYTECAGCIFCEVESHPEGAIDIQTGCYLDRLDKFPEKEIKEENYFQFYRINNRICNTYRNQKWEDLHQINGQYLGLYELKDIVLKEVEFSYDYIINLNDSTRNLEAVKNCVNGALNASIKPRSIIIVKNANSAVSALDLFRPFKNVKEETGIKLSVEIVMDDDSDENKMNKAVARCLGQYFVWQDDLFPLITSEFVEKINNYLNIDLGRFVILRDEFFSVWYKTAFDMVGGNGKKTAIEKLTDLSSQQNNSCLIKEFEELNGK